MDQLRFDLTWLPAELYRVQYPNCQTTYCSATGLRARDTSTFYSEKEKDAFRQSIVNQFTWGWRQPTPYITVFSDKKHAENWALSYSRRVGDSCKVIRIDSRELRHVYVFKLSDLQARLDFEVPVGASQHVEGAFLCLHRIRNVLYLDPKLLSKLRTVRNRYVRQTQIETVLTVVQSEKSQCAEKVSIGATVTVMTFTKVPKF